MKYISTIYRHFSSLFFLVSMLFALPTFSDGFDHDAVIEALSGKHRSEENIGRDKYRHPAMTLEFFDVHPEHTVVEIWPGGGWYTEVLAPYLKEKGKLYAAHFSKQSTIAYYSKSRKAFDEKLLASPDVYGGVVITELEAPEHLGIAPEARADRVLTFRNVHNWLKSGTEQAVFKSMFLALKPGGILGVVEHRADPDASREDMVISGYVTEAMVIKLAEEAGFILKEKSEINANSKDDHHHPKGVWTLPPRLRLGEQDREVYVAIGESDRMTLSFIKPKE